MLAALYSTCMASRCASSCPVTVTVDQSWTLHDPHGTISWENVCQAGEALGFFVDRVQCSSCETAAADALCYHFRPIAQDWQAQGVEARFVSDFFDWFDSVTEPANLNWAVAGPSSPNALRGFRIVPGSSRLQVSLPSGSTWIPDSSLLTLDDVRRRIAFTSATVIIFA